MEALQARGGRARRRLQSAAARSHQITLQRHVIDAELRALRAFWQEPGSPDPRCVPGAGGAGRQRSPEHPPNWYAAARALKTAREAARQDRAPTAA